LLFSTLQFWGFFAFVAAIVFANRRLYRSILVQNLILVVTSFFFYATWDARFLALILINILTAYAYIRLPKSIRNRKIVLAIAVLIPLLILGFFKYYNFFIEEFAGLMRGIGMGETSMALNIILPVGISFYTFQTISLIVDYRRGHLEETPSLLEISTFIAFFPQLVAGPIERARNFIPQLKTLATPTREQLVSGASLILLGLALKIGVADVLGALVDPIFARDAKTVAGGDHAVGLIFFSIQIYADFCGYSTIAIGVAKLLGFELMANFLTPYFAPTLQDFWQRWHISLSTFFRDYVYFPLGGSKLGSLDTYRNLFITFVISGLWHGASWTFVIWGTIHGVAIVIERLLGLNKPLRNPLLRFLYYGVTISIVTVSWEFFRAPDLGYAIEALIRIATNPSVPTMIPSLQVVSAALLLWFLVDTAWHGNPKLDKTFGFLPGANRFKGLYQLGVFTFAFWMIIIMAYQTRATPFVYFQF